MMVADGGGLA